MPYVIDSYKEGFLQPPEVTDKSFYIYNPFAHKELWGILTRVEDNVYSEYKLNIQYEEPLGKILTDFISVDMSELSNLSKDASEWERLSLLESVIGSFIFSKNEKLVDDVESAQDAIQYWGDNISSIRRYIDICNKNETLYGSMWYRIFRDYERRDLRRYTDIECFAEENELQKYVAFLAKNTSRIFGISHLEPIQCEYYKFSEDKTSKEIIESDSEDPDNTLMFKQENVSLNTLTIETYEHPMAYFYRSLEILVENKLMPKRCRNCGNYFIPEKRSDTIYCSRQAPQDPTKTCKKYGSDQVRKTNIRSNEAVELYRKVYQRKQAKLKYHRSEEAFLDFENYKKISKQLRADVKAGIRTESEFLEWLKTK